jgi:hypothetical protein
MTGTSEDFLTWTEPQWLDYTGAPPEHLYTNAVRNYPGAPHILIGFPTRFLPPKQQTEPTLMVSRDGTHFHRYQDPVIPPTAPEMRDGNRSNYMAWGLHQLPGKANEWSVYAKEAYYTGKGSRLRRFTYRPDGLAALAASVNGGEAITRPIEVGGRRLIVNFRTAGKGTVRVEVQDADGKPCQGFALSDCKLLAGDDLAAEVAWSGGSDLGSLVGQSARLRFVLQDAELFSFRFHE